MGGCQISMEREKITEAPHTVNVGDSVSKIIALILASEIIKAEICAWKLSIDLNGNCVSVFLSCAESLLCSVI